MGAEDYPLVQGDYTSWAEIQPVLSIPGTVDVKTKDFAGVNWKNSLTPAKVPGAGPVTRGRTVGVHDADAQIMMYQDSYYRFLALLMQAAKILGATGYGLVPWNLITSWTPLTGPQLVKTVTLFGARIIGDEEDHKPGAEANVVTVPLSIIRVERTDSQGNVLRLI